MQWKPYKDKESVFWSEFKKDGDIGLITKFKGSDPNGYTPDVSVRAELDGYVYSAKAAVSKKTGKPFYVIERKQTSSLGEDSEEQKAHNSVAQTDWKFEQGKNPNTPISPSWDRQRQERIDKAHQENLEVQRRIATANENLNDTLMGILKVMQARQTALEQEIKDLQARLSLVESVKF